MVADKAARLELMNRMKQQQQERLEQQLKVAKSEMTLSMIPAVGVATPPGTLPVVSYQQQPPLIRQR
jgi:hypothetical protein